MNHFGELRALVGFVRPHVALVTTIAPAHLEFFGTCEAIADAKSEIFEGIVPGGAALIPPTAPMPTASSPAPARRMSRASSRFGETRSDARLTDYEETAEGSQVKADVRGPPVDFRLGAPGKHIAQNAVGALLAVAMLEGDVLNAAAALKQFTALKGRGARFSAGGVEIIDESYNANPASMAAALAVLGAAKAKRRIAVLGDMLEMGPEGTAHHVGLAKPLEDARADLVFASGAQMKALWDALPACAAAPGANLRARAPS